VKHILSIAAIVSALASPAIAEDVPWAGLYVGASFDWGIGTRDITVPSAFNPRQNSDRFGYGATGILGYNWQSGPLIFGVEADAGWGNIQPRMTYLSKTTTEAIHIYTTYDYQASLRARIGYVLPWSVLGFVTGGGALVHSQSHIVETMGVGPNWGQPSPMTTLPCGSSAEPMALGLRKPWVRTSACGLSGSTSRLATIPSIIPRLACKLPRRWHQTWDALGCFGDSDEAPHDRSDPDEGFAICDRGARLRLVECL